MIVVVAVDKYEVLIALAIVSLFSTVVSSPRSFSIVLPTIPDSISRPYPDYVADRFPDCVPDRFPDYVPDRFPDCSRPISRLCCRAISRLCCRPISGPSPDPFHDPVPSHPASKSSTPAPSRQPNGFAPSRPIPVPR